MEAVPLSRKQASFAYSSKHTDQRVKSAHAAYHAEGRTRMHNTVGILVCHHPTPDTNIALSAKAQLTLTSDGILVCR